MVIFAQGDVISRAEPLVHVLNFAEKGVRCDSCFKSLISSCSDESQTSLGCSSCEMMHYCSTTCAHYDLQRFHAGAECDYYSQIRRKARAACFLNTPRLILRLYFLLQKEPHLTKSPVRLFDGGTRCLHQLLAHEVHVTADAKRMKLFSSMTYTLDTLKISYDQQLLFRLFGQTFINAFTIFDQKGGGLVDIGRGVYLEASVFDHSCSPNANYFFDGVALEIRANRRIDTDCEPVLINYLNANVSRPERRLYLQRQYYFTCHCDLCTEEERKEEAAKQAPLSRENLVRRICAIFYY